MYLLASIVIVIASLILKNDAMMQAAGLFAIAGSIEMVGSNLVKKIDRVETEIKK